MMESNKPLKVLTLEQWVRNWISEPDDDQLDFDDYKEPSNQEVAEYFIRLFERPGWLKTQFTRDELSKVVWNICGVGGPWQDAVDSTVPEETRRQCILSIGTLYTDLFDPLCSGVPFENADKDQLCGAVWMIWDMDSIDPRREDPLFRKAYTTVFQIILGCQSTACIASGLHGIGHWIGTCDFSGDTELSAWLRMRIDDFLAVYRQRPDASQGLIAYALAARTGSIM